MFDPSVPKRLKPHHIATIFNQKMYEALVWRMQQDNRFSADSEQGAICGAGINQWDIVIGQRFAHLDSSSERDYQDEFGIVIGTRTDSSSPQHDHFEVAVLTEVSVCKESTNIGASGRIYHEVNNTFRTITVAELPAFWAALEAYHA